MGFSTQIRTGFSALGIRVHSVSKSHCRPTGTDGDQQAAFKWTAPVSRGSAIQSYTLEISPAPANGVTQITGITGTSYTWKGLKNGTDYQVRVRAVNKASKPSAYSAYSAAVTPAGKPFKPSAPTAVRKESAVDGGVVNVAWNAPGTNGAPITGYTLRVFKSGTLGKNHRFDSGLTRPASR